jgi:hypothetical protein
LNKKKKKMDTTILHMLAPLTQGSLIYIERNGGTITYYVNSISICIDHSSVVFRWAMDSYRLEPSMSLASTVKLVLIYGAIHDFCRAHNGFGAKGKLVRPDLFHVCIYHSTRKLRIYIRLESGCLGAILFFEQFFFAITASPRIMRPRLLVSNTHELCLFIKATLAETPWFSDPLSLLTQRTVPWHRAMDLWDEMGLSD